VSSDKREISAKSFLILPLNDPAVQKYKPFSEITRMCPKALTGSNHEGIFVVENIQSQTTFACTNRTYRTISVGHFMSLCCFIVLLNVVSLMSGRNKT
jgi:hypothetical protein